MVSGSDNSWLRPAHPSCWWAIYDEEALLVVHGARARFSLAHFIPPPLSLSTAASAAANERIARKSLRVIDLRKTDYVYWSGRSPGVVPALHDTWRKSHSARLLFFPIPEVSFPSRKIHLSFSGSHTFGHHVLFLCFRWEKSPKSNERDGPKKTFRRKGQISIKVIEDDGIKKKNLHKKGKEGTKLAKKHRWINVFYLPKWTFFRNVFCLLKLTGFFSKIGSNSLRARGRKKNKVIVAFCVVKLHLIYHVYWQFCVVNTTNGSGELIFHFRFDDV